MIAAHSQPRVPPISRAAIAAGTKAAKLTSIAAAT